MIVEYGSCLVAKLVLNGVNRSMRPCFLAGRPRVSPWCNKARNITWSVVGLDPCLSKRCTWHNLVARSGKRAVGRLLEVSTLRRSHTIGRVLLIASQAVVYARKKETPIGQRVQKLPVGLTTIHGVQVDKIR